MSPSFRRVSRSRMLEGVARSRGGSLGARNGMLEQPVNVQIQELVRKINFESPMNRAHNE